MKTLRTGLLTILSCAGIASLHAQTADEIVSKHIAAIGGKTALASMKSLYIEGIMEVMGTEVPDTTWIVYGKAFKNYVNFNGQEIIQVATEKGGWMVNPMAGAPTPTEMPAEQANISKGRFDPAGISGPLVDYASKGVKVEYEGKDTAGGVTNYKLKATTKENVVIEYFIDAKTYNVSKAVTKVTAEGQEVETTIAYSDYKKLDNGFPLSYSQQITLPQITLTLTHKKVELNKTIDPAIFEMPKN
jgi:hypothetical protein